MRVEKKKTYYTLKFSDKELRVIMECLKGAKLEDCRDQSLVWDLLSELEELFDDRDYEAGIINSVLRKPSDKAIQRNKDAQVLLRKLRGN